MNTPGFKSAAVQSGMRYRNRLDLTLIAARQPVAAAGVFTTNLVKAAPVVWSQKQIESGWVRAILANAGQANACTGDDGYLAAEASARAAARLLGCAPEEVLLASTGVIGEPLAVGALEDALPGLVENLAEDQLHQSAEAIMTTDTRPKVVSAAPNVGGRPANLLGMAKGSGMIRPDMATMLSFILTDVAAEPAYLKTALKRAADRSFNRITVDGDTSTNDCVFLLASAEAGGEPLADPDSTAGLEFEQALTGVMADLAKMIVADGEGATKLVKILVSGAVTDEQARAAAMTVAESPLVKTALFGEDANWGRIMAALGRSGAAFDPERVDISVDAAPLVRNGRAAGDTGFLKLADEAMKRPEFSIQIDLAAGNHSAEVLTCDFSLDYVKINADYRS